MARTGEQHAHTPNPPRPGRVLGLIPARWGSTRFPGKSLAPICGKPLVQWVYERARQARRLAEVWVATDDERIRRAVENFGGRAVMTRPDHPSGTDRIAEAARGWAGDILVNVQGDEPLIDPRLIDEAAGALEADPSWDMATAAAPIRDAADTANPSVVKVVWAQDGRALYFSRAAIPFVREAGHPVTHYRHIGLYAYRRAFLDQLVAAPPCPLEEAEKLEQLRALHLGARMMVLVTAEIGPGVDSPEDVTRAETALRRAGLA
jgi:3-deoxy-manno-octulosonate cytidylyltransferase (CMP-KDO synthetase)